MPTMYEIYDKHSYEYDELLRFEDHDKNLPAKLNQLFDFRGKKVLEFGTGTGRLTAMYGPSAKKILCYDRSGHMLDKAKVNLSELSEKITFGFCDNNDIGLLEETGDFLIEGWSFGHTVSDFVDGYVDKADELINSSLNLVNPGGTVILIETLGTNAEEPGPPTEILKEYYRLLEEKYGFTRVVIPTDYKFNSVEEAARICGFFFGAEAEEAIREKRSPMVKEFTGLWYKSV
ncbi:class I SAM-dependent methyltransferase [Spirochaeta isovalerica]|uniref:Ubiquinone/menaquinone biosynthesis C-methylase UbiE n=1 Tax=Spirochaeta isovalerica TaxID=150 RepID=A0A841R8N5_9SPIO|nr:class I SAM-dependent methyltransferase [Spirochaeta isovalerica]MBB6480166.1 ubiquinone/menaquinone biosynthesis C-methylase UbiE [Spirochaeta isovalerica]